MLLSGLSYTLLTPMFPSEVVKGTVRIISCDLSWHVLFTMIPFKSLLDQGFRRYSCLYSGKLSAKKPYEFTIARIRCTQSSA